MVGISPSFVTNIQRSTYDVWIRQVIGISPNFVTNIQRCTYGMWIRREIGISPNFVTNTSVGTFSVLKRSRTSVGKYIYDFRRGEAELRISTILGEAKPSYVYVRL